MYWMYWIYKINALDTLDMYIYIYIYIYTYCKHRRHTSCKMYQLDKENVVVGTWKSKFWWQNTNSISDFNKQMIRSPNLCGHLALGTFSETYLKDLVLRWFVTQYKSSNMTKSRNVTFDTEIKHRIVFILPCPN